MQGTWSRGCQARVGLLVLGSIGVALALLTWAIGVRWGGDLSTYRLVFTENVKGLVVGSRVNFQGVPLGSVRDIRFAAGSTLVEVGLDPERAVIQEVTRGRLDRALVTGQVTVELEGWERGAKVLRPGGTIQTGRSSMVAFTETLPDVAAEATNLVRAANELCANLNALLGSDNRAKISAILAHVEAATRELPVHAAETLSDSRDVLSEARAAAAAVRRSAEAMRGVVDDKNVKELLATVRRAAERFEGLEARATELTRELRDLAAASRSPLLRTLTAANDALLELRSLARRLQLAPSSVLFGSRIQEVTVPASPAGEGR